jgi:2-polyprenyl-3-methyl-5-hydroxy-6-metoxy-1,4-benzoquinol methylase
MGTEMPLLEIVPTVPAEGASRPLQTSARSTDPGLCRYFDETAPYWDQIYTGRKFINWHLAQRKELVIRAVTRLSQGESLKVLDLGSGTGCLTRDLLNMGHSVAAIDCSEKMIRTLLLKRTSSESGFFFGAALASVGETCFRSAVFDIIICIGVIQYQQRSDAVFEEISRLLRPGGHCIFTIPNQLSFHHLLDPWCIARFISRFAASARRASGSLRECCRAALDRAANTNDLYERRYFRAEIASLVRPGGFEIKKLNGFGYGPLTFVNRSVLPDRLSILISKALTKASGNPTLSWLSGFANRWVVVLQKPMT